jgi:serine/threonine protein kinase
LAAAHAQGLVHRDVKPSNILLDGSVERAMLTDFGLARAVDDASITRTGIISGTPQYMSPEQARGEPIDHRSDLFSLGSVLYAMCTGHPPFRADTTFGVLHRVGGSSPHPICEINADVPAWLGGIVSRLMSKAPKDRFATATEVATLLEQCLAHVQQPTAVSLPSEAKRLLPPSRKDPNDWLSRGVPAKSRWIVLSSMGLIALGLGLFWINQKASNIVGAPAPLSVESSTIESMLDWSATQTELDSAASFINDLKASSQRDLESFDSVPNESAEPSRKEDQ